MEKLTGQQVTDLCASHPGWELAGGELVRTFRFVDFPAAVAFVNRVAVLAETAGHHPDIDIRYNTVRLGLITHDAGGISARDADFVAVLADW